MMVECCSESQSSTDVEKLALQMGAGLAGAGVRRAAALVSGPLRSAQRRYCMLGRQLYLYPHAITTAIASTSSQERPNAAGVPIAGPESRNFFKSPRGRSACQ